MSAAGFFGPSSLDVGKASPLSTGPSPESTPSGPGIDSDNDYRRSLRWRDLAGFGCEPGPRGHHIRFDPRRGVRGPFANPRLHSARNSATCRDTD